MQVSIYLIQFGCFEEREQALLCAPTEEDKVKMHEELEEGTTKQRYPNHQWTIQHNAGHQDTAQTYQRTNKRSRMPEDGQSDHS